MATVGAITPSLEAERLHTERNLNFENRQQDAWMMAKINEVDRLFTLISEADDPEQMRSLANKGRTIAAQMRRAEEGDVRRNNNWFYQIELKLAEWKAWWKGRNK